MELQRLLEICKFTDFPFDLKPTKCPNVWAGRPEVLNQLEEFRYNVEVNGLVEFGILTGDHGSGKSHSLLHLKYLVDTFSIKEKLPKSLTVYIDNPCGLGPKATFTENYRYILNHALGRQKVIQIFHNSVEIINTITSERLYGLSKEEHVKITSNEELLNQRRETIYIEIVGGSPISYRIFKAIAEDSEGAWEWLSLSNPKISTIADEKVQPLASHILCAKSLGTIIKLASLRHHERLPMYGATFILVDQTEDLATLKPGPFQEQIGGWRTLLDEVERYFGMMWAMDGAAEDVSANFTDAIQRRQTIDPEKLKLLPLEDGEAKIFLTEVMKRFRKEKADVPSVTYPFTEDGLQEVVNQTLVKNPSALLNIARTIFARAAKNDVIRSTKDSIDKDVVVKLL